MDHAFDDVFFEDVLAGIDKVDAERFAAGFKGQETVRCHLIYRTLPTTERRDHFEDTLREISSEKRCSATSPSFSGVNFASTRAFPSFAKRSRNVVSFRQRTTAAAMPASSRGSGALPKGHNIARAL